MMLLTSSCSSQSDGGDECTLRAIGRETGAAELQVDLQIPSYFVSAAEIRNGGILMFYEDCDYPLNAFLSRETANYLIESAPKQTLTLPEIRLRLATATLGIWKFKDGSREPRFFVTTVHEVDAVSQPRSQIEAEKFELPN
jgi:hypothetical protein